jgi:hypothetical protein
MCDLVEGQGHVLAHGLEFELGEGGRSACVRGAAASELGPRGKFRCIFTAKFTTYCG